MAIRCDGLISCDDITGSIVAKNGGDMYFSGYIAASQASATNNGIIQTTNNYDIICSGHDSCKYQTIQNGSNLYCIAGWACYQASLIQYISNVYVYGMGAAYQSTMNNIFGNIYCGTYEACYESIISNVGNSVYGISYRVLYNSIISNIGNNLIVFGKQGLYGATINSVKEVCVCCCVVPTSILYSILSSLHCSISLN